MLPSSGGEHYHALHDLSLQVNASAEDSKNETNASHDSTSSQPNFTEVSITSRSAEPTGDTENGFPPSGGQSGAPKELIGEAPAMPVDEKEEANRLVVQNLDLQKTLDALTSLFDSVKEDNLVLKSENQVLSQCTKNVMHAPSSFHQMLPRSIKCSRNGKK